MATMYYDQDGADFYFSPFKERTDFEQCISYTPIKDHDIKGAQEAEEKFKAYMTGNGFTIIKRPIGG